MADDMASNVSKSKGNEQRSPIGLLLESLGMTREDLTRHSAQMREFLTAENANSLRALVHMSENAPPKPFSEEMPTNSMETATQLAPPGSSSNNNASVVQSHRASTPQSSQQCLKTSAKVSTENTAHNASKHHHKKSRKREREPVPSSASPVRSKFSLDMIMQMRSLNSERAVESEDSDESEEEIIRNMLSGRPGNTRTSPPRYKYPHPAKAIQRSSSTESSLSAHKYQDFSISSAYGKYYRNNPDTAQLPITPQIQILQCRETSTPTKRKSYYRPRAGGPSHLPPSSPIFASSPLSSSPMKPVNLVSSPGPMSDPPDQSDPDLPFILPPGPYLNVKPELSYAALIGRAILASPNHALRLKDIYDYIGIVFPHFKRDGNSHTQKWMNAVRQNLTNTPQFYKRAHPDGTSKASLWCIRDEDLPCFANGSYNRHALAVPDQPGVENTKKRKKAAKPQPQYSKRIRLAPSMPADPYHYPFGYAFLPGQFPPPFGVTGHDLPLDAHADFIFPPLPPSHPSAHLINQILPVQGENNGDVIFPPLPAYSQTRIVREQILQEVGQQRDSPNISSDDENERATNPPLSASSESVNSIPELTPDNSSSSPVGPEEEAHPAESNADVVEATAENPTQVEYSTQEEFRINSAPVNIDKGKQKASAESNSQPSGLMLSSQLPQMPTTPTPSYRATRSATRTSATRSHIARGLPGDSEDEHPLSVTPTKQLPLSDERFVIPPDSSLMKTPTARRRSPHATPTRSSVRFKALTSEVQNDADNDRDGSKLRDAVLRTPSRSLTGPSIGHSLLTPRRNFSPYIGISPFRTPSQRMVLDPADPSHMLEEELRSLASKDLAQGLNGSPVGFFEHGKGLLYESPTFPGDRYRPW